MGTVYKPVDTLVDLNVGSESSPFSLNQLGLFHSRMSTVFRFKNQLFNQLTEKLADLRLLLDLYIYKRSFYNHLEDA